MLQTMKRTITVFNHFEIIYHNDPLTSDVPPTNAQGENSKSSLLSDVRDGRTRSCRTLPSFRGYKDYRSSLISMIPRSASIVSFIYDSVPAIKTRWGARHIRWLTLPQLSESPIFWLGLYFLFNLCLTLYNKSVLIEFPFPYTLTALHAFCSAAGSALLLRSDATTPFGSKSNLPPLNLQEIVTLISFSMLFTINIAVSNISLDLVTVPFHQVVRATTPVFILLLSKILLGSRSSRRKLVSLVPVIAGASIATYGDYYFTRLGLVLTLLGTVLSALKTIIANMLQTSTKRQTSTHIYTPSMAALSRYFHPRPTLTNLSPLQLLYLLSPLACLQSLFLAYVTGEMKAMCYYTMHHLQYQHQIILIIDGLLAFGLNITSFGTNKRVGALTIAVAANIKQVLTMLVAVVMFDLRITSTNALGIALTLAGGALYTAVELLEKPRAKLNCGQPPSTAATSRVCVESSKESEGAIA